MRVGKLALMVPVMTSTDGRWVAMIRWMPAARAIWARRWIRRLPSSLPATSIRSAISSMTTTRKGRGSGADLLGLVRPGGTCVVVKAGLDRAFEMLALRLKGVFDTGAFVVAGDVAHAQLGHACDSDPPSRATVHFRATTAFFGSVTTGASRCGMPS